MEIFLLKSAACMAIFLLFYKLLLEKESIHHFKRFFLLIALIASFIIPQIVFTEYIEITPSTTVTQVLTLNEQPEIVPVVTAIEKSPMNWSLILWTIYGLGVAGFAFRFLLNLAKIWRRVKLNTKIKNNFIVRVLLKEQLPPHTFLHYIFLNKQKFESKSIPKSVLRHEETHATQRHSLDVLFLELLQVIFWFNPLIYVFKKTIKLNHEFLADSAVLNGQEDHLNYQNTLLSYLSNDSFNTHQSVGIANAINYSSIKKRFIIMKKQTSKKGILLRSTLLLPLLAILLFGFSETRTVLQKESNIEMTALEILPEIEKYNSLAKKYNAIPIEKRKIPLSDLKILESTYRSMTVEERKAAQPFPECLPKQDQDDATKAQLAEYNNLANKYNTLIAEGGNIRIMKSDVDKLNYIYDLMSDQQKTSAEPFPDFPEPPPTPMAPKVPNGHNSPVESTLNFAGSPNSPKTLNTISFADKQLMKIIAGQDPYDVVGGNISIHRKPLSEPPFAPTYSKNIKANNPPPPPTPPNPVTPLDYVINAAKNGASFIYEDKDVSSDEAIELLKKNKELNIESRNKNGKTIVRITKDPVTIN